MTEHTSIRVAVDAKERASKSKRDGETWNEYLQRCTDNPPEVREYVEAGDMDSFENKLNEVFKAAKEATNAAQSAEHAVENMGGRQ